MTDNQRLIDLAADDVYKYGFSREQIARWFPRLTSADLDKVMFHGTRGY